MTKVKGKEAKSVNFHLCVHESKFVRARLTFCARTDEILSVHEWVVQACTKFRSCTLEISFVHARIFKPPNYSEYAVKELRK